MCKLSSKHRASYCIATALGYVIRTHHGRIAAQRQIAAELRGLKKGMVPQSAPHGVRLQCAPRRLRPVAVQHWHFMQKS